MMKKIIYLSIAVCLLFFSCNNKSGKRSNIIENYPVEYPTEGVKQYIVNGDTLFAIEDTKTTMEASLFEDADSSLLAELIPDGYAEASVNVFLLVKNGKTFLIDAGNGIPNGDAADKLRGINYPPEDIDYILLTHLHSDHIGGMLKDNKVVYPYAQVYVSLTEYDYWVNTKPTSPYHSNMCEKIKTIVRSYPDRFHFFKDNDTICNRMIYTHPAYGHTPGHSIFEVEDLLFVGDILHAEAIQIEHPELCTQYDYNKNQAIDSRIEVYDYAAKNRKIVASAHMPFPGIVEDFSSIWDLDK